MCCVYFRKGLNRDTLEDLGELYYQDLPHPVEAIHPSITQHTLLVLHFYPVSTMIFANTLSLVLALAPAALLAAPSQPADSIANLIPRQDLPKAVIDQLVKTNGICDLSKVVLPVGMLHLLAPHRLALTNAS